MSVKINQNLCAKCGICVDVCPVNALSLTNSHVQVDEKLCTNCGSCVDVCPRGAIYLVSSGEIEPIAFKQEPVPQAIVVSPPVQIVQPDKVSRARGLAPLAGAALGYLGREVAPRLADTLISVLEQKLSQPSARTISSVTVEPKGTANYKRGIRRQTRYRRGRNGRC